MYIQAHFTNGAGNQLFQYFFAYLLARHHNATLLHSQLDVIEVNEKMDVCMQGIEFDHVIGRYETDFLRFFEEPFWRNLKLGRCYPEDYRIYIPHIDHLKSQFPPPSEVNERDLVFHLRLGDRLLRRQDYELGMKLDLTQLLGAINKIDFERLHIVTDMPYWRKLVPYDIKQMRFHMMPGEKRRIEPEIACDHFNNIVDFFSDFDLVVHTGNNVSEDFKFIRSFKKVLFQHATLSWWAAAIGNAEQVGVYGPWRPNAGKLNRNLGRTPLPGWFSWG
ncbi:MAG: hypothetical protein GKR95_14225 [Gammaproteobacteria bacterium]|nr:hypothetical protein [Gammaproteobacteria bacterium]